jgi:hypothetical protein
MSIYDDIQSAQSRGELMPVKVSLDSDTQSRVLLLSKDVYDLVYGPFKTESHEIRAAILRANLESFVRGLEISMCLIPKKGGKTAAFGLLEPIAKATFDFRSLAPRPSLRILGHFAACDTFVALTWWPKRVKVDWSNKEPLGDDDRRWRDAITECNGKWWQLLPNCVPVAGLKGEKYVSAKLHIVGT